MRIAAAIRELARKRDLLPARKLADAVNAQGASISWRTAHAWLKAENDVPGAKVASLVAALGVDVPALLRLAARVEFEK